MRLRFGSRGNARRTARRPSTESRFVVRLPLHRNVPSGSELTAPNTHTHLKEPLPLFMRMIYPAGIP